MYSSAGESLRIVIRIKLSVLQTGLSQTGFSLNLGLAIRCLSSPFSLELCWQVSPQHTNIIFLLSENYSSVFVRDLCMNII